MGQAPQGDGIDTRLRDGSHMSHGNATGRLEPAAPATELHATGQGVGAHVVQQDPLRAGPQGTFQLDLGFNFNFDGNPGERLACRLDRLVQIITQAGTPQAAVVVFHQHPVVQAHAVVAPTATADGILFEYA